MFDLVNGLPVHPLVVHAIVVLLPLAVLGTWAIALVPRWRTRYGPLVVAAALLSVLLIPVATESGEALASRVGEPEAHEELAESLIWFAIPLLVLVVALVGLSIRQARAAGREQSEAAAGTSGAKRLVTGVAVVAALAGLATAVQVFRVGDSGAKATWSGEVGSSQNGDGDADGD